MVRKKKLANIHEVPARSPFQSDSLRRSATSQGCDHVAITDWQGSQFAAPTVHCIPTVKLPNPAMSEVDEYSANYLRRRSWRVLVVGTRGAMRCVAA